MDIISRICKRLFNLFFAAELRKNKRVQVGEGMLVRGRPIIDVRQGANLFIGNNVTLNSDNHGYHASMHSPVKIFADRPGAKISIGDKTRIHGSCLHAYSSITVGNNCLIAANCQIIDGSGHDLSFGSPEQRVDTIGDSKPIVIEDNVWIGLNSIILPGVTIGKGSVIAAGSVVTKNIPPMVVAAGVPAKVVKMADN